MYYNARKYKLAPQRTQSNIRLNPLVFNDEITGFTLVLTAMLPPNVVHWLYGRDY